MKSTGLLAVVVLLVGAVAANDNTRYQVGGGIINPGFGGVINPGFGGVINPGIGGVGINPGLGGVIGGGGISAGIGGAGILNCGPKSPTSQRYGCEFFTELYGQYVCDRNQKPAYRCPPRRATCTRFFGGPPQRCITDNNCGGSDKCCCDACLDHHVCKPPA